MMSLRWVAIDAVKRLNFCGVALVLSLALVARANGRGRRDRCGAHGGRGTGNRHRKKQVTTTNDGFVPFVPSEPLQSLARQPDHQHLSLTSQGRAGVDLDQAPRNYSISTPPQHVQDLSDIRPRWFKSPNAENQFSTITVGRLPVGNVLRVAVPRA